MQVKIKKNKKTQVFNTINTWQDVTLESWVKLINLHKKSTSEEALETISALSDIPKKLINELDIQDVALITRKLSELQNKSNSKLQRIIEIENKKYGFHPNLSEISLGEWSDLEHFIKEGVENYMPQIMAILYRPIVEQKNDKYTIEAYTSNIDVRAELFKNMKAENVQSAMVFFYHLGKELLKILQLFLIHKMQTKKEQLQQMILRKNGGTLV